MKPHSGSGSVGNSVWSIMEKEPRVNDQNGLSIGKERVFRMCRAHLNAIINKRSFISEARQAEAVALTTVLRLSSSPSFWRCVSTGTEPAFQLRILMSTYTDIN